MNDLKKMNCKWYDWPIIAKMIWEPFALPPKVWRVDLIAEHDKLFIQWMVDIENNQLSIGTGFVYKMYKSNGYHHKYTAERVGYVEGNPSNWKELACDVVAKVYKEERKNEIQKAKDALMAAKESFVIPTEWQLDAVDESS